MSDPRHVAVIDIGKTNAKLALVDLASLSEMAVRTMPNVVLRDGLYPHYDCAGLWAFIRRGLAEYQHDLGIDAISITTHGVAAALLSADGALAMQVLDYEHDGPEALAHDYDAIRPPFLETGTPRLPAGLNLGAQLFWQSRTFPQAFGSVAAIVTYPQYWAYLLSGVLASEATSLGCHTDFWNPFLGEYSSLVHRMGWAGKMPPLRRAGDRLGPVLPELARKIGLKPDVPVHCGIHDSNASLYPHLLRRTAPFSVVSTGTWVVAMAVGAASVDLDPRRDTLVNVNAFGDPTPSARFMGGREYAMVVEDGPAQASEHDVEYVLSENLMLSPSVQQGSGPFPQRTMRWTGNRPPGAGERFVCVSFYLAMMTATCLDLIGSAGDVIVEGPFAKNHLYLDMLASAMGRPVRANQANATGTSVGAAQLVSSASRQADPPVWPVEEPRRRVLARYADSWRAVA